MRDEGQFLIACQGIVSFGGPLAFFIRIHGSSSARSLDVDYRMPYIVVFILTSERRGSCVSLGFSS